MTDWVGERIEHLGSWVAGVVGVEVEVASTGDCIVIGVGVCTGVFIGASTWTSFCTSSGDITSDFTGDIVCTGDIEVDIIVLVIYILELVLVILYELVCEIRGAIELNLN